MGSGGGEQKPSQAEIAQAKRAKARMEEWSTDGYKDLELQAIADSRTDLSKAIGAVNNADANQAAVESDRQLGLSVGQGNLGQRVTEHSASLSDAQTTAVNQGAISGQQLMDAKRLNAVGTGQDVAIQTDNMFSSAAARGAAQAQSKLEANTLRSRARTKALVDAAAGTYIGAKENTGLFKSGIQKTLNNAEQTTMNPNYLMPNQRVG